MGQTFLSPSDVIVLFSLRFLTVLCTSLNVLQQTQDLKSRSDEMDMLNLVLKKFKSIYYNQEQMRHFPTYDILNVSCIIFLLAYFLPTELRYFQ